VAVPAAKAFDLSTAASYAAWNANPHGTFAVPAIAADKPAPADIAADFDPTVRSNFRCFHSVDLRYNDVDSLGHVTSISFLNCLETARVRFVHDAGLAVDARPFGWMLVKLDIDYLGQLHFPGRVTVGTRLARVGRSSIITIQGLFDGERCSATLKSTIVHVDRSIDRAAAIPADLRTRLWQVDGTGQPQGECP
jgi:acyl-CoA thioester hydrolase